MAGNALPLVLLAGAALLLMKKKGGGAPASELPADQGASADNGNGVDNGTGNGTGDETPPDETAEEEADFRVDWTFDPTATMPWVETLEDYQAWSAKLDADEENAWTGSLEFRDMAEHHAELGVFIEEEMAQYGQTIGRTIDRAELDPAAVEAMKDSDMAFVEKGIVNVFENTPGLDFLLMFVNDSLPMKMAILFVYDSFESQSQSMGKMGDFKSTWEAAGVQVAMQAGYIGMESPSLMSVIKAFLNANLPKKTTVAFNPVIDSTSVLDP